MKRGLWSPDEDEKLIHFITTHGLAPWSSVPKLAGLERCGKSCRLRWINYLRPDLKRGSFTAQEERIIVNLHRVLGNKWAQIAKQLPGRTDNEVKNFWNTCIKKKLILSQAMHPLINIDDTKNALSFPHYPLPNFLVSSTFAIIPNNSLDCSSYQSSASCPLIGFGNVIQPSKKDEEIKLKQLIESHEVNQMIMDTSFQDYSKYDYDFDFDFLESTLVPGIYCTQLRHQ